MTATSLDVYDNTLPEVIMIMCVDWITLKISEEKPFLLRISTLSSTNPWVVMVTFQHVE